MDVIAQYHAAITTMLQKIADTQKEAIRRRRGGVRTPSRRTGICM